MAHHYLLRIDERGAAEVLPLAALPAAAGVAGGALADALGTLTRREMAVLRCVAAGLTYQEVGAEMGLAAATTKAHMTRALDKIGAPNSGTAAAWMLLSGLLAPDDVLTLWRRWRPHLVAQD